jgi:hypothetical protein
VNELAPGVPPAGIEAVVGGVGTGRVVEVAGAGGVEGRIVVDGIVVDGIVEDGIVEDGIVMGGITAGGVVAVTLGLAGAMTDGGAVGVGVLAVGATV